MAGVAGFEPTNDGVRVGHNILKTPVLQGKTHKKTLKTAISYTDFY